MQRHYQVDLGDLWRGRLSLRRLRVLVAQLPSDSATAYVLSGITGPLASWRLTDLLLGRLADELTAYRWQWESAHLDPKKGRPRKPPQSLLPDHKQNPDPAEVPVVSPHALGSFVNGQEAPTDGV